MHFLTDFFFLVPLGALGGVVFLEVSDNPHLSLRYPHCLLFFLVKLSIVFNHDCSDCKIMELMASLCFGPRFSWKKQPTLILFVYHQHYHHQTQPHPLFIVSLWTQIVMAEAVG